MRDETGHRPPAWERVFRPRSVAVLGPPGIGWDAAVEFERATQMWSQRRRAET